MFRKVPPIAFPMKISDFLQMLIYQHSQNVLMTFEKHFAEIFNLNYCYALSSGKSALTIALMALKKIRPEKTDVIIPAYTCPTVLFSVAKAGLNVKLCDISLETLNIDVSLLRQLVDDKTLCVLAIHMFGFPCDMEKILKIVEDNKIFLVEDVAQSAGAKWKGQMLGSLGHLSCFSFGRGKILTTYEGGILGLKNGSNTELLRKNIEYISIKLNKTNSFHSLKILTQLIVMYFLQGSHA